ncbi:phosphate acyltransferase PlsX [Thioclava sp. GXIMD4216]|uniref:phosphate acyltransferase PlsX n=2 Tax=Thioclava sp. GXIMD4216 TaxID=3131929 RepID=UPI0030D4DAB3
MLNRQDQSLDAGQDTTAVTQGRDATAAPEQSGAIVISVDAMGGDHGPSVVVDGVARASKKSPELRFLLNGPEAELKSLVDARGLGKVVTIRHASDVVRMEDKPSQVMRNGKDSSMWASVDAVREKSAQVAVSCGNTGALMALSMLRLRKLPGVNRPAIASFWPSQNSAGWCVMLDMGADIKADAPDLLTYALMGSSYCRNALNIERPRVGLLNVGTEEHKGRAELKEAYGLCRDAQARGDFEFVGFVEGSDLSSNKADVIVTDGFTGNIALKTGEGTAKLAGRLLKEALTSSVLSKLGAMLAMKSLKRLSEKIDPRRANGGVFLGLNGTVVKSHGSADALGVAAAIDLAARLAASGFAERLAARVASDMPIGQDAAQGDAANSKNE